MPIGVGDVLGVIKRAAVGFWNDQCPRMAAALSYYTIFSLPPLLILLIMVAGLFLDPQDVQGAIEAQIASLIGPEGAVQVREMIRNADRPTGGMRIATVLGVGALIFGATGAFVNLQTALNDAWHVEPDPKQGGIKNFIVKRIFSFGLVLAVAFLMLVSLSLAAALSAVGNTVGGGLPEVMLVVLNFIVSFAVITFLFAAMYKVMPDASIAWRDVWVGAVGTATLFVIGKFLLGFYLGRSDPGSAFGAAGSLALVLVWVYYASMIVLFGAEFTQEWAQERGGGIRPEKGATRVVEQKKRVRPGQPPEVETKSA
ncbi:MAG TPA: YihY/virulence factor BrkB family protein [Gemmatimonadaceae bacterium]|nr:YihY/virulence factor BrkB family protein [Gemmatimonadaceae bacterium]